MAFVFNGASNARLRRLSGLIASCDSFQFLLAVKRTGSQVGNRFVFTFRSASSGHDVMVNNPGVGTYAPICLANFGEGPAGPLDVLTLNEWWWLALGGTGSVLTLRTMIHGGDTWNSDTVTASSIIVPTVMHIADVGDGSQALHMKGAQLFEWDDERTEAELLAQASAAGPIITDGLVSFKSGVASSLALALTGDVGVAFENMGGVSLDSDLPVFGPTLTGSIQLPSEATVELVEPEIESITTSGTDAILTIGNIDPEAAFVAIRRAPSLSNGQPDTNNMERTDHAISAAESSAGLKVIELDGHAPGQTYHYYAWVYEGLTLSTATDWSSVTFDTLATLQGIEGPDVGAMAIEQSITVTLAGVEQGDFAEDDVGPDVTIFVPATVTTAGTYPVTISATDLTGVGPMDLYRNGVEIGSYVGAGPHTYTETASFAENGTREYHVVARDLGGNETETDPVTTTIAILQGEFSVDLEASASSVTEPGTLTLTVEIDEGVSLANIVILILQNGSQLGQAITQAPYTKQVQYLSSAANGTYQYQAKATLSDGSVGYSNIVTVTVSIPAEESDVLVISTGMADMIEIPRRDTSRALMFRLTDSLGGALTGALPSVMIAKDNGAYEAPTGVVAEMSVAGLYAYWPSAEDVNDDGPLSVSITATGATPVPVIHCRVVTPYGKR